MELSSAMVATGEGSAPGRAASDTLRGACAASNTVHDRTSSQSWSSASIQKIATAGTLWSRDTCSASLIAVSALKSVNSGPPKSPACCPVTTATVLAVGQQRAGLARTRRRAAPRLLVRDDGGNLVASAVVRLRPRDPRRPTRRGQPDRRRKTARTDRKSYA
jgi:hypothetical protein